MSCCSCRGSRDQTIKGAMGQGEELEPCVADWAVSPEMLLQGGEDSDSGQRRSWPVMKTQPRVELTL